MSLKSLETLKKLKDRNMINEDEDKRLRINIQRNNISADLIVGLIIRLSDRIEELKEEVENLNYKIKTLDLVETGKIEMAVEDKLNKQLEMTVREENLSKNKKSKE